MLDGREVDLDVCHDMGVAIFAGEARGRLESVIADVAAGRLAPIYNYMPAIEAHHLHLLNRISSPRDCVGPQPRLA
jgi:hypothetical protein